MFPPCEGALNDANDLLPALLQFHRGVHMDNLSSGRQHLTTCLEGRSSDNRGERKRNLWELNELGVFLALFPFSLL